MDKENKHHHLCLNGTEYPQYADGHTSQTLAVTLSVTDKSLQKLHNPDQNSRLILPLTFTVANVGINEKYQVCLKTKFFRHRVFKEKT